jgi:16S rRNA pseudouridine516 synthase
VPRLDALLARNLGLSRREVTRLLRAGRVCDDSGRRIDTGALPNPPSALPRTVLVDGEPRTLRDRFHLLMHKPLGVVTALSDPRHPTAYALLRDAPLFRDLRAVGRLDKETCGLLPWTTDGTLLHRITHPKYAIPRTYEAALLRAFDPPPRELILEDGHRPEIVELRLLDPQTLHPATPRPAEATAFASVSIVGGRFHEVRRLFAALGTHVVGLCRTAFGPLHLPEDLAPGGFIEVDLAACFAGRHPRPPGDDPAKRMP